MNFIKFLFIFVLFKLLAMSQSDECFVCTSATVTVSVGLLSILAYKAVTDEKCPSSWTGNEFKVLNRALNKKLYGQTLAINIVTKLVQQHMTNNNPDKALVLSFHGWTGNGKNFVSHIVAQSIYDRYRTSDNSDHVKYFLSTHFNTKDPHLMRQWIKNNITNVVYYCPRSLFIFDEVDKLPVGVIDVIKSFVDYNKIVDGIDYRKSIFIFLSNTGGTAISRKAYEFHEAGVDRIKITWKDLEPLVISGAFNEYGGLHKSDIVEKGLIDAYVPFLPLNKRHVEHCIVDYLKNHHHKTDPYEDPGNSFIKNVVNEMEYFPADTRVYSKTGCKRVASKVDTLL